MRLPFRKIGENYEATNGSGEKNKLQMATPGSCIAVTLSTRSMQKAACSRA
ncbi:hypothetical protein XPU_0779 [Xanthomonas arboricola pv. pruni str. MAFF 311562]|uniref:Uncharacterized protein n=1 Tax=Xanthomonas arboricola pv. pruni str. MAFF 311562 TaxID=1414836 RepID=W4RYM2_9XANT|nr:hypothetical protein XPU_0779 [Xanthomonas arboricola pv. pruni str. MAFF 311562]